MTTYILDIDETYRLNGEYSRTTFTDKDEAICAYRAQRRGFTTLTVDDGDKRRVLLDTDGRKYAKGSPFYSFPHVPHTSILDGKEIETT